MTTFHRNTGNHILKVTIALLAISLTVEVDSIQNLPRNARFDSELQKVSTYPVRTTPPCNSTEQTRPKRD